MPVTSEDVARLAGVSRSAVSRAFTDGASVAPETRARIHEAAARLGYRPSPIARGLSGRRTGLVALIVGTLDRPFEAELLGRLAEGLRGLDARPLVTLVPGSVAVDTALTDMLTYRVDGAIAAAGSLGPQAAELCAQARVPLVMVNRAPANVDAVLVDNAAGIAELVALHCAAGRRRLAWIGGTAETFSEVERSRAFRGALAVAGLELHAERRGNYSVESGLVQALALLTDSVPPDAILCGNDAMAIGALSAARRLGRDVPGDVAISGFDGIAAAGWETCALTTVDVDVAALADNALGLLRKRLAGSQAPTAIVRIAPRLVRRTSA